jgi:hypothetical protein
VPVGPTIGVVMKDLILKALKEKYAAEMQSHLINIQVMIDNPTAIQEHQDFISALDVEIEKYTTARDKLESVLKF